MSYPEKKLSSDQKTLLLEKYFTHNITAGRQQLIRKISMERTRYLSIALEDIYQPHNAAAVLRSCDCLGIQDIHIMETRNQYRSAPGVEMGAGKWLDLYKYNGNDNVKQCFSALHSKGYRIAAMVCEPDAQPLTEVSLDTPLAVVMGTEEQGLSPAAVAGADLKLTLPMYGFTRSFNVSVCAALTLYALVNRLRSSGISWRLNQEQLLD
ncbi:MAG TPA: RNA methyltransferase, partial [Spirochaetota bacterium]|nr:RNA methyltransferase [Spirochaetota bacterium]